VTIVRHDGTGVKAAHAQGRLTPEGRSLRVAGVPLLMAAVMAGGPGWTSYLVQPGDTLTAIARRHGTDPGVLARLNGVTAPGELMAGVRLTVPVPPVNPGSLARRKARAAGLHPVEHTGSPRLTYRVRPGDTISEIARRAGTSERAVLAANGMRTAAMIRVGQDLTLPSLTTARTRDAAPKRSVRPVLHVVRPGDTLGQLALTYGVPLARVLRANRLTTESVIRPGQKVLLPGARARARARHASTGHSSAAVHVVRRGETVSVIARRHGTSVSAVLGLNHLGPRSVIYPGRRLLLPGPDGAGTPAGTSVTLGQDSSFLGRTYPAAVVTAARANRQALLRRAAPDVAQARDLVSHTARRYGVDPALALAVAQVESSFDHHQVSPANAIGLMQVIPSTGVWSSQLAGRHLDLLDAEDNVTAGVVLLASLIGAAPDSSTALAGYYQGLASVRKNGMFADTRRYVATVRTLTHRFR
jgi:N-acetylmuramoyl-L-alanine amidase